MHLFQVSGIDSPNAHVIQAFIGVNPLHRRVWHQTTSLGMTISVTTIINGRKLLSPGRDQGFGIWDTKHLHI